MGLDNQSYEVDRCPECGQPAPGTGEAFLMTGWRKGGAWQSSSPPAMRIAPDGTASVEEPPDARWVEGVDVPVVELTCRCDPSDTA